MPIMSEDFVKVYPRRSRSAMSLAEIRDAMAKLPPKLDGFVGGWASTTNTESNLRTVGLAPPSSTPVISPATDTLPEILKARFYYWDPAPAGMKEEDGFAPLATRKLNAIDVMITELADGHVGLLFSTRTTQYLNRRDGVIASLNKILQQGDPTIRIERSRSHLEVKDEHFFLWLTVQRRDKAQLAPDLLLDMVSGINSTDRALRTAELRSSVDFDRPNFLTAVAEGDVLGPISIHLVQHVGEDNHGYEVRVHSDGGFEIRKNDIRLPDELYREDVMQDTCLHLAFSLIPRINSLYGDDAPAWSSRRIEIIEEAMSTLQQRYAEQHALLQAHKPV